MKPRSLAVLLCLVLAAPWAIASTPERTQQIIDTLELRESAAPARALPGWAPRRVVVSAPPAFLGVVPDYRARLSAVAGDVELVFDDSADFRPDPALLAGADGYIGFCTPEVMAAVDADFRWLHSYLVGMDACAGLKPDQYAQRLFTNAKRLSAPAIAEHTIAMMLALARGLPAYHAAQLDASWDRAVARSVSFGELHGKTLLVVGLGGIGTEVARRAHGLGMRVIATRRSSREGPDFVDRVGLSSELLALAAEADVVVNALPLTGETQGLFNAGFFAAMPKGSMFLSVGRGESTVTADLVAALESGHLYGAGLDVTDPEPLPADSPLWQLPNVIITPHISAAGADSVRRGAAIAVENLRRYVAGERLLNEVNMAVGY